MHVKYGNILQFNDVIAYFLKSETMTWTSENLTPSLWPFDRLKSYTLDPNKSINWPNPLQYTQKYGPQIFNVGPIRNSERSGEIVYFVAKKRKI